MHIPDGFVNGEINIAAGAVTAAVGGYALYRANRTLGDKQVPLLGVTAAFVFAAQMLNFPVAGGTSGHFLGGVLAAVLLGPLNAVIVLASVLLVQGVVFADGGLTALGTNIFNMGIVGGVFGYLVFRGLRLVLPAGRQWFLGAVFGASWLSIVLASIFASLELAISGTSPIQVALPAMVGVHAIIGVGEALITSTVVSMVMAARPDLISTWKAAAPLPYAQEA